ncbi:alpha/beta hydrolase [Vibrio parahaemolyticus]|uniref:alpha/beta hydrolase n=1 Tax=Vibrio parahaemolyticus TaxID=670 RepID=UPI00111F9BD7|nr:alpha/beta hydrolase-fold protein [Vibrio parahaemolyticus]TOG33104.1 esterase [Vibrio parahaemolyticus]HCM1552930.1 alpha/beta hydrolase [Vibrio parahaemolyticus]
MEQLDLERLIKIDGFYMPELDRERTIRIYLPKDYNSSTQRYPVIYMHDGQTIFDGENAFGGQNWHVHSSLDKFFSNDGGAIVVGIDNGVEFDGLCRMYEYSPWKMDQDFDLPSWDQGVKASGGQGKLYTDFIVKTLKPYIDAHFRTKPERESTVIAGSSMGGYISLFAVLEYPGVFSKAGVFSPALWFNESEMMNYIKQTHVSLPTKIYLDMGTDETSDHQLDFAHIYLDGAEKIHHALKFIPSLDVKYVIGEGDKHDGDAWGKRFPLMLEHFFT